MTNQGRLMAINYGGWSANPDPEEEEVSIFYSLSSDTDKCRVSGERVKNVTCINGNTRWSNVGTFPWLGQTLQTGTDACWWDDIPKLPVTDCETVQDVDYVMALQSRNY